MIAAAILQSAYNDLYTKLRNYIWEYDTVVKIADLEVATYMAFPDIDDIRRAFDRLRIDIKDSDIYSDDEELQQALDDFEDKLEGADQVFYRLDVPEEVEVIESSETLEDGVFVGEIDLEDEEESDNDYQEESDSDSEQGTEDTEEE